jgi:hypothetical protein
MPRPGPQPSEKVNDLLSEPVSLVGGASAVSPPAPRSSAPRLIVSTGLFVSAFLLLNAYLDRSTQSMALFGTLTVVFLVILLRIRLSGRQ